MRTGVFRPRRVRVVEVDKLAHEQHGLDRDHDGHGDALDAHPHDDRPDNDHIRHGHHHRRAADSE